MTVRRTMNPWAAPSAKRTGTGAAASGRGHSSTATRTSEPSVAALANHLTVEQDAWASTGVVTRSPGPPAAALTAGW